jgi:hypothetical protein
MIYIKPFLKLLLNEKSSAFIKSIVILPLIAKPLNPTAIVKKAIATAADFEKATTSRKTASKPKPLKVNYILALFIYISF